MPELPEVETVKNALQDHLVGRTFTQVSVRKAKVIAGMNEADFVAGVTGQTVASLSRRGKFLTIHLHSGARLVLHLRMTGCLTIDPPTLPYSKHTHLVLGLDDGNQLRFEDLRQFGRFWLIPPGAPDPSGQTKLGIEPDAVTVPYLRAKYGRSSRCLKTLLLDQNLVAGIGNIYSDEICFTAGILPTKPGNQLTEAELNRLCAVIPERINYFIDKHHVSFAEYALSRGKSYKTDAYLQVYGHKNQPCPQCGTALVGKTVGGRSSVWCPTCQR